MACDQHFTQLFNDLDLNPNKLQEIDKTIYKDLHSLLKSKFPEHRIHFYGSYVTGLNFKDSHLDVYIENIKHYVTDESKALQDLRELFQNDDKFIDSVLVRNFEVPYVKVKHTQTETVCDVNIRNKLPIRVTNLLKYYLSLDKKVSQLIILVKCWADRHHLFKKQHFFSGYALQLLVIFYLQQEPYKLPSVVDLQKNLASSYINKWNCAFVYLKYKNSKLLNANLLELLTGFFQFYNKFDYIFNVISPFYGRVLKKISFLPPYDLPRSFVDYVKRNQPLAVSAGICVQDFFQLKTNVTASVSYSCCGKFISLCGASLQLIQSAQLQALTKPKDNLEIFHEKLVIEKYANFDDKQWINFVKHVVLKILCKIFGCEVKEETSLENNVSFVCTAQYTIWGHRINVLKELTQKLPTTITDIDREIEVSQQILNKNPQKMKWDMKVQMVFQSNPSRVEIFLPVNSKSSINLLCSHFLQVSLENLMAEEKAKWVDTTLNAYPEISNPLVSSTTQKDSPSPARTCLESDDMDICEVEEENFIEEDVPLEIIDNSSNDDFIQSLNLNQSFLKALDSKLFQEQSDTEYVTKGDEKSIAQLFFENRITLSDFIYIMSSNKVNTGNPTEVEKKNQVISHCLKAMSWLSFVSPSGLQIISSGKPKPNQRRSPLLQKRKFKFTSFATKNDGTSDFEEILYKMLTRLGIFKIEYNLDELLDSVSEVFLRDCVADKELSSQILAISLLGSLESREENG